MNAIDLRVAHLLLDAVDTSSSDPEVALVASRLLQWLVFAYLTARGPCPDFAAWLEDAGPSDVPRGEQVEAIRSALAAGDSTRAVAEANVLAKSLTARLEPVGADNSTP